MSSGFEMKWRFHALAEGALDAFWLELIDFVEARQLWVGGGSDRLSGGAFVTGDRGVTPAGQAACEEFLAGRAEVAGYEVGPVVGEEGCLE